MTFASGLAAAIEIRVAHEELAELAPFLGLLPSSAESGPQPRVGGVKHETATQRLFGGFGVARLFARLGKSQSPRDTFDARREIDQLRQRRSCSFPFCALFADTRDSLEGVAAGPIALEHLLVCHERRAYVAEAILLDLAQTHEKRELPRRVVPALRGVELRFEEICELRVAPGLLEELREHQHRLRLRRILVEDTPQRLDRVVGRAEPVRLKPCKLEAQMRAFILAHRNVDQARKEPRELLVAPGVGVESPQRRGGLGVGWLCIENLFVERDGSSGVSELVDHDGRGLVLERQRLCTVDDELCAPQEERDDLGVIAHEGAQAGQLLERPHVAFILGDQIAEHRLG